MTKFKKALSQFRLLIDVYIQMQVLELAGFKIV